MKSSKVLPEHQIITVTSDEDWQQLDDLVVTVLGQDDARLWRVFHGRPPFCQRENCKAIVLDGRLVSHVALVPRAMRIGSVTIRAGTIGYVATHPEYQGRGYARRLMEAWTRQAITDGYHVGYVHGIPDFYGKFGYRFAFAQDAADAAISIDVDKVPKNDLSRTVRPYQPQDLSDLVRLYDEENALRNGTLLRSREYWEWLLEGLENVGFVGAEDRLVCLSDQGTSTGYLLLNRKDRGRCVIWELAADDDQSMMALLAVAAQITDSEGQKRLFVRVPLDHQLVELVLRLGGELTTFSWGVYGRIFDLAGLFRRLKPELSRRLIASPFCDWTGTLSAATDLGQVTIGIRRGQIFEEQVPGPRHTLAIPQSWLVKLVTGYADPASLMRRRGVEIRPEDWSLLRVLFPKSNPYIWAADSGY